MGLLDMLNPNGGGLFGNAFDWRALSGVPNMAPQQPQMQQQAIPQNAQLAQGMMPQPDPGMGDRFNAGIQGLLNAPTLLSGIGNLISGVGTGQRSDPLGQQQALIQNMQRALLARGVSPADAALAASSPEAFKTLLPRLWPTYSAHNVGDVAGSFNPATGKFDPQYAAPKFEKVGEGDSLYNVTAPLNGGPPAGGGAPVVVGAPKTTDDIREYNLAKTQGFKGTLEDWMQRKRGGAGEYGLQPIWGTGPDGKPAVLQLGKSGTAIQSVVPEGFNIAKDPIKVEGPTGTTLLDPQTRQQIGFIPKDVAGAASAHVKGEAQGTAEVNLPQAIATAETTLKTIQQLKEHPGKQNWGALGMGAVLPDMPGSSTRGFGALVDQIKGQNFLTAFNSLKGAGAITEVEGVKAEKAQARLDRMQNRQDFDAALKDLEDVVKAGMERAKQKAKGIAVAHPAPATELPGGWSVQVK